MPREELWAAARAGGDARERAARLAASLSARARVEREPVSVDSVDVWTAILSHAATPRYLLRAGVYMAQIRRCCLQPLFLYSLPLPYPFPRPSWRPRDAAALACVCARARDALRFTHWHRALRVSPSGRVHPPSSGFDVTVAPGEDVQAAVEGCPPGGCVLLLPGVHAGPMVLGRDKEVHVFGGGQATLLASNEAALTSFAARATVDGLMLRRTAGDDDCFSNFCVWLEGSGLRLQSCYIWSEHGNAVNVIKCADPTLVDCT